MITELAAGNIDEKLRMIFQHWTSKFGHFEFYCLIEVLQILILTEQTYLQCSILLLNKKTLISLGDLTSLDFKKRILADFLECSAKKVLLARPHNYNSLQSHKILNHFHHET